MERSAPLPVRVDVRISTSCTDGLHPLAASELLFAASRIRSLRLVGLRTDILRVLHRLRSPAAQLEALNLSIYDSGAPVDLPESLFGGEGKAPRLRRLTFAADTCVRAPLWLLKGLSEFTTGADIALPELLEALRAMPQLQVLRVQHCRAVWDEEEGEEGEDPPRANPAAVSLPHLQLVSFWDTTPRRFVLLVPRIDAPPTVRRQLFWRSWAVASWVRWAGMLSAMRRLVVPRDSKHGADDGDFRVARVTGGPARGSFCAWTRSAKTTTMTASPSSSSSSSQEEDALFLFQIDWRGSPVDPRGETLLEHSSPFFHLAGLCALLGLTRVQDLTVEPDVDVPEQMVDGAGAGAGVGMPEMQMVPWESLVGALLSVQSLRLRRGTSFILHVLSANSLLLPHLQKLYVVQCNVRCTAEQPPDGVVLWNLKRFGLRGSLGPVTCDDFGSVGNRLVALVRARCGLEVILIGCGVDAGALDELRKHGQVDIGDEWVYV